MNSYIYVGNRSSTLKGILEISEGPLPTQILALENSYLHRELLKDNPNKILLTTFKSKKELHFELNKIRFDVLISCGCPYKIQIDLYKNSLLINIHPSDLPQLKGKDPGIGALMKKIPLNVSIHKMNQNFDEGELIWQWEKFPLLDVLDIKDVYAISAIGEYYAGLFVKKNIINSEKYNFKKLNIERKIVKNGENDYFKRSENYGLYDSEFSNSYLEKAVRASNLDNYGLKAALYEINKGFFKEIKIENIKNIGIASNFSYLFKDINLDKSNQIIYFIERRILWIRNSELLILDIREKLPFYLIQGSKNLRYSIK